MIRLADLVAWLAGLAYAAAVIAFAMQAPASPSPCIKPTAMPSTWFGNCEPFNR